MKNITHEVYRQDIETVVQKIKAAGIQYSGAYGIPRGGTYPASMIARLLNIEQVYDPDKITPSTLIVDDLVDSGKTLSSFPNNDKAAIYVKNGHEDLCTYYALSVGDEWVVFPDEGITTVEDNCARILQYIGEDISREGLVETPARMKRAYDEIFAGYKMNPDDVCKTFVDGACKEPVMLKDCEYYSTCEHHFFPFFGKISIAYIPNGKVIGVSKLARLVDCFSKRMQIQERMTAQIAETIERLIQPAGVFVYCTGKHFCMTSRGVKKQEAEMITMSYRGAYSDHTKREEILKIFTSN
ncbi:MAG: GTP cyclohydrolase I FolE [Thermoguttaceae bacterium]|nr:GTP cyclohydrolase I FolE [Thermoguttaceae bacterium]